MSIVLKRNYEFYISKSTSAPFNSSNTVKLLVKDFSFNRASNTDKAERKTLDANQERIVTPFISVVSPVTFSFSTYIKPLVDTNVTSPEEYLWTSLMGNDTIAGSPNSTPTSSTIDFSEGNVGSLHELTLWFTDPNSTDFSYRIDNAIVDSARISFDINDIATIEWEGRALDIVRQTPPPPGSFTDRTAVTECLKNRFSTITTQLGGEATYTVALTGGSIDIKNNCEFYNQSQLGKTTIPIGHYTGNREISGNLDFYVKQGTSLSADLYDLILNNADADNYESTYYANITINIGGTVDPYVQVNVPRAILEIPRINFEEALTMGVPFLAQEGTGNYSTVIYNA